MKNIIEHEVRSEVDIEDPDEGQGQGRNDHLFHELGGRDELEGRDDHQQEVEVEVEVADQD